MMKISCFAKSAILASALLGLMTSSFAQEIQTGAKNPIAFEAGHALEDTRWDTMFLYRKGSRSLAARIVCRDEGGYLLYTNGRGVEAGRFAFDGIKQCEKASYLAKNTTEECPLTVELDVTTWRVTKLVYPCDPNL